MKVEDMAASLQILIKQRNSLILLTFILSISLLLSMIGGMRNKKSVVLLPSNLHNEMIVSEGYLSDSYLESFARDIISVYSNVTPANIEYSNEALLKMVYSSNYASLKKSLEERRDSIKRSGISQHFFIQEIEVDSKNSRTKVIGEQQSYVGDKLVSKERKTYMVGFKMQGMLIKLVEFREVTKKEDEEPL